jgi:hypothetical protein
VRWSLALALAVAATALSGCGASPAPETDQRFQLFVTAFYNAAMPAGWSVLTEAA